MGMSTAEKKINKLIRVIERKKRELSRACFEFNNPMSLIAIQMKAGIASDIESKIEAKLEDCIKYEDISDLIMALRGRTRPESLTFCTENRWLFKIDNITYEDMIKILKIVAKPILNKVYNQIEL